MWKPFETVNALLQKKNTKIDQTQFRRAKIARQNNISNKRIASRASDLNSQAHHGTMMTGLLERKLTFQPSSSLILF